MPNFRLHAPQLAAHLQAQKLVERRQRLVQQQHARIGDQRARQRDALLLPARKLRRQPVGERLHAHAIAAFPARAGAAPLCPRRAP